jgi:hypothetical protein
MLLKSVAGTIAIAANVAFSKVAVPKVRQTSIPVYCRYHQILLLQSLLKMYLEKYCYKKESLEQLPLPQMLQFQKLQYQRSGKPH